MNRRSLFPLAIVTAAFALGTGPAAWADAPVKQMRNVVDATVGEVTFYSVKAGFEQQFLEAMVEHGSYHQLMGGVVNEKVLMPLADASSNAKAYWVGVARYLDAGSAKRVAAMRDKKIAPFLDTAPERLNGTLVQHVFADWGWEKGRAPGMIDIEAGANERIFKERVTTLSYLKSGYTGQAGFVEYFAPGAHSPNSLRTALASRGGLSGASIFSTPSKGYVVYSEYFNSPNAQQRNALFAAATRAQAGTVELNYVPR